MGGTDIGKSGQKLIDWTELKCMWSDVKQRIAGSSGVGGRGRVLVNSIVRTLPCISWMPNYKRKWLMGDLVNYEDH